MTSAGDRLRPGRMGVAALIVGGGILVSRVLGVVREIVFAAMLGADAVTDEYVAAFRIPDFANYLLAGGFLAITFIPIFSKYLADDEEPEGWRGFTAIIRWLALGITALIAIAWFATPMIIEAVYPDFDAGQIEATVRMTRIVLPAQFAFVVGAMLVAVQYAKGVFTIPTLAPIVYNLAIITGGIAYLLVTGEADPIGFIWGALAGAFIGNLFIQWWGARRVGMRLPPGTGWFHPAVGQYIVIAIPLMIGQSIVALDDTFMSLFGETVGDGAQTHLQYARRTMLVPVGIIAQAAAVAAYPFLSRLFAEGKIREMNRAVDRAIRWVLALSIAAAGLLTVLSLPVIRTLFERFAFDEADSVAAASALFFYAFAIPIWGGLSILTRAFYAKRDMWTPVIVGTIATVVAVPTYLALTTAFGIEGVAVASVIILGGYTVALAALWYRSAEARHRLYSVLGSAGRAIPPVFAGAGAAFVVGWAISANVPGPTTIVNLVAVLAATAAFAGVALSTGALLYDALAARRRRGVPRDVGASRDEDTDLMDILG